LYCTFVLLCTVLYCYTLICSVLYCTVLRCIILYWIALYCTVLFCTGSVLYCEHSLRSHCRGACSCRAVLLYYSYVLSFFCSVLNIYIYIYIYMHIYYINVYNDHFPSGSAENTPSRGVLKRTSLEKTPGSVVTLTLIKKHSFFLLCI